MGKIKTANLKDLNKGSKTLSKVAFKTQGLPHGKDVGVKKVARVPRMGLNKLCSKPSGNKY